MSRVRKYWLNKLVAAAVITTAQLLLVFGPACAAEVVDVSPEHCRHGLHQPEGGDFAVFVFCDDALGTQLGIIYTRPGVRPAEPDSDWNNGNRFWQQGEWVYDALDILWPPSGDYLYVTTAGVYGHNGFYELDLRKRTATKLLSGSDDTGLLIESVTNDVITVNRKRFKIKN